MNITLEQAENIWSVSSEEVKLNKGYRIGQAVWNNLPVECANHFHGGKYDIFYSDDMEFVQYMLLFVYTGYIS